MMIIYGILLVINDKEKQTNLLNPSPKSLHAATVLAHVQCD